MFDHTPAEPSKKGWAKSCRTGHDTSRHLLVQGVATTFGVSSRSKSFTEESRSTTTRLLRRGLVLVARRGRATTTTTGTHRRGWPRVFATSLRGTAAARETLSTVPG